MVGKLIVLVVLVLVGGGAWHAGRVLSPSAVSMAYGVIVGVLAPIPSLVLLGYAIRQGAGRQAARDHMTIEVVHRVALPEPPVQAIIGAQTGYSVSRPFALPGVTVDGEVVK